MPKPNLFIIGAMKSGTSSLHSYLATHPQIFMSDPKEPSYFVEHSQLMSVWPQMADRGYWKGEEYYLQLFEKAHRATIIGESSTNYTKLNRITQVPQRIAAFQAGARFIYIMRDPIERTISHYWHAARFDSESRDMMTAIRHNPHYREVSHYAMQLAPYYELFGPDRVLAFSFEELTRDPSGTVRTVFEWLGVDPSFAPANIRKTYNVTPAQLSMARGSGILSRFRNTRMWDAVGPLVPPWIRALGRDIAEVEVSVKSISTKEVTEYLRPIQQAETVELKRMLGREFPEWKNLYAEE